MQVLLSLHSDLCVSMATIVPSPKPSAPASPGSQKQRVCGCESHRRFTGELIYRCKHMSGLHTVLCTFPTRYGRCIIYTHTHMYLHTTLNARLWAVGCATTMCFSSGKNHIYNHIFCCITISNCDSVIEARLHRLHTP